MACALHVVDDLRRARVELLAACDGASDDELRRRPAEREWAAIEVLAHLADVDRYYLGQAKSLRDVPGHTFVYFDDEAWKRENEGALERDARAARLAMAAAHDEVARWAGSLTPEELDRAGGHPRRGSISVREMLQRVANHDRTHAGQIAAILRAPRRE